MAEPSRKFRCAIYTRKSTEDGLDQEFNSLDAQFEACRAYILSQRHEGWSLLNERYDDAGFSGGNLERPSLKKLLEQVASRKVDIIVIYKVDRLTRSLADFAKIVDVLDGAGASFVSITQSFNTTTSMGRLTLNMLLSFAQFEREVTSERIRDKIAASKRKGLWMGGPVPLGYEVRDRKLVVNEAEAEVVRHIMRRYCELNSVRELVAELRRDGIVTKVQKRVSGPHKGGIPFARGSVYHLLKNRIYLGEIVHKGSAYPGEHSPIVPIELWDRVQAILTERATSAGTKRTAKRPSLLAAVLFDNLGRPMVPSHTTKGLKSYRYYVTRPDLVDCTPALRVAAYDVETNVCSRLAQFFSDDGALGDWIGRADPGDQSDRKALRVAASLCLTLKATSLSDRMAVLRELLPKVTVSNSEILIEIDPSRLVRMLDPSGSPNSPQPDRIRLTSGAVKMRRRRKLEPAGASASELKGRGAQRNDKLIRLLAEAHLARQLVELSPDKPLSQIANDQRRCRTRLRALVGISCMAPDIIMEIVGGRWVGSLGPRDLLSSALPMDWTRQRQLLGSEKSARAEQSSLRA